MKKILYTLLLSFLLACSTQAALRPAPRRAAFVAADAALTARSLQLTCYLTDVLRLSDKQAREVRRATLTELQQQKNTTSKRAVIKYDAALLRILNAGQYSTFRWLQDRQPVANLLINPDAAKVAQR
ncbi:hypothetical protein [Hymenobacter perfusus]|uniref:DUF4296 domain-containing protein n=1 Tax=Hymenobacter perfusus TaxID=1236770 RepID=A0A3R9NT20_9BACT|nr:hypothetical protein [Hymenobacter perfusus]RSK42951.1 hypothetical protein EI293_14250 [Hymenobacter perfusus]